MTSIPGREGRPLVLVTLGTVVDAPDVLVRILRGPAVHDVNVVLAPHPAADLAGYEVDASWVQTPGVVPMAQLLDGVAVVVSSGGAGTVLSASSVGVPMVLLPLGLDEPDNAERAVSVGAAPTGSRREPPSRREDQVSPAP